MGTYFESVPNITTIEGRESKRLVTQKFEVTDQGVRILCRSGVMGGPRDIDIGYDELVEVDRQGEYTFDILLRTGSDTYTVTNVTSNDEEIAEVVEFVRDRIRTDGGGSPPSRQGGDGGTGTTDAGSTSDSDPENATATGGGSDTDGGTETGSVDVTERLRKIADLRDDGVLTEEEFERKKEQLLESDEW